MVIEVMYHVGCAVLLIKIMEYFSHYFIVEI